MGMTEVTTLAEGKAEDKDLGYYERYYQPVPLHLASITVGFQSL
jgi:CTP synthase (UTP-ammonia lyase)